MGALGTVLVVDDQEGIRKLLEETCSMLGFNVVAVPSGMEAIQATETNKFNAALIDMKMPGLNGIETMQRIHAVDAAIKVALMTGYGEMYLMEDSLPQAGCSIIRKPFDIEEIRNFLDGASALQEA
ncbi:MAG: response regulator [Clostridia bacterium]|nr:response regulator [Clostridia bacterium]